MNFENSKLNDVKKNLMLIYANTLYNLSSNWLWPIIYQNTVWKKNTKILFTITLTYLHFSWLLQVNINDYYLKKFIFNTHLIFKGKNNYH